MYIINPYRFSIEDYGYLYNGYAVKHTNFAPSAYDNDEKNV